jgi:predicted kinase
MKNTVFVTVGLPASGKSTWARETWESNPDRFKLVSRDELRSMLDSKKWSEKNEKFVEKVRDFIILQGIADGKDVIVHDTNFGKNVDEIRALVAGKADVSVVDFTDVPLQECIDRDRKRGEKSVGEKVIKRFYNQFLKVTPEKPDFIADAPDIIICDLDGTLALMNGRGPYDPTGYENDILNMPVAHVLHSVRAEVIFVSGRKDTYREQTQNWLNSKGFGGRPLFMRKGDDDRNDAIVKKEIYEAEIKGKYNVLFCLDDRNRVVQGWRDLGLTVFQVADGDF